MTVTVRGWVGSGEAAKRIGVSRQSIDSMIRRGRLGAEGVGWILVPAGGSRGGSYLVSPEGVKAAKAYWRTSARNPNRRTDA